MRGFSVDPFKEINAHMAQLEEELALAHTKLDQQSALLSGDFIRPEILKQHYITDLTVDSRRGLYQAVCACSRVHLGWHVTGEEAMDVWISHVVDESKVLNYTPPSI